MSTYTDTYVESSMMRPMTAEHYLAGFVYAAAENCCYPIPQSVRELWRACIPYLGQMRWGYDLCETLPREGSVWRNKATGDVVTVDGRSYGQGSSYVRLGKWGISVEKFHKEYSVIIY